MARSRICTTTLHPSVTLDGEELYLIAEVRFVFHPDYPETGPTYDCGGEPGEGPGVEDVEVISLRIDDEAKTPIEAGWLKSWIEKNYDADSLIEAVEDDGPDPDDARDRQIDDELCDRANGCGQNSISPSTHPFLARREG